MAREDVKAFMEQHSGDDVQKLVLKYNGKVGFDLAAVAEQIALRKKAEAKIPSFIRADTILLPKLFEQSTHEEVSKLKTEFIKGDSLLDLTAGLGVDAWIIGRSFKKVTCIESEAIHTAILRHNYASLGFAAEVINIRAEDFLERDRSFYDIIYIDPDRRPAGKREQFEISNSEPDIVKLFPDLLKRSKEIWIKLSPMVSIHDIKKVFGSHLHQLIGVAFRNELKEILVCLKNSYSEKVKFTAANIKERGNESGTETEIFMAENPEAACTVSQKPKKYFFEPNVALIKTRLAFEYAIENKIELLYPDGSYFTTDELKTELQGRIFEVIDSMRYKVSSLNAYIKKNEITQGNIACRNFHWKPDEVRKTLKLKDGGDLYLFCYNDFGQKPIAVWCRKT
jgi:16S rRNA G966 N2-methylase RsmD